MHIGIVGCGQLARMLALAGLPMGLSFSFLGTRGDSDECVKGLGRLVCHGLGDDPYAIYCALGRPSVITVEKEDVEIDLLRSLGRFCPVLPDPDCIEICQHRGREKAFLLQQGIPVAPFVRVSTIDQLQSAVEQLGYPAILKSCEHGYDGQNQWNINSWQDLARFSNGQTHLPDAVLEQRVEFTRELSVLVVRGRNGETETYPVTENHHLDGILNVSLAPTADFPPLAAERIQFTVERLLTGMEYVGVLAVECFQTGEQILVNELAPRVHNSGHWTQLGSVTSQFENHLRAIMGWGLGAPRALGQCGMVNLLGSDLPGVIYSLPNAQVHLYNKRCRPRRKMGHVNLIHDDRDKLNAQIDFVLRAIPGRSDDKAA